jgi:LacI family transcriptional regulator
LPRRPTAIVCGNEVLGFGAQSAARETEVVVPSDLSIIGFDDIAMASWPLVSLTTVRCDLAAMADVSVRLLTDQFAGEAPSDVEVRLPTSLLLRATHGPAPDERRS